MAVKEMRFSLDFNSPAFLSSTPSGTQSIQLWRHNILESEQPPYYPADPRGIRIPSLRGVVILDDAMYPPIFVDPDRPISEMLREFRGRRRPMAIVRTKEGPILGIITLEDIVEEIVGEIEDEHDTARKKK